MKKIYLTFDMDWVNDDVLKYFYEQIYRADIQSGVLYVTNYSKFLEDIRKDGWLELGIHPNFNWLLCGEEKHGSIDTIITELKGIVPEAVTARSHSLVTGTQINQCFYEHGIKYVSNYLYEPSGHMRIQCFKDYLGLIHVPFFFEDDIYLMNKVRLSVYDYLEKYDVPLVFNFHPIHLFLNTENRRRYESSKEYYKNYPILKNYRNTMTFGIEDFFRQLVRAAHEKGYEFETISNIEWRGDSSENFGIAL